MTLENIWTEDTQLITSNSNHPLICSIKSVVDFFLYFHATISRSQDIVNKFTYTFVCLVGFLMSSSTTRLYCRRAPRQSVWQFYVLPHMRQSWETMTSVSAGHIIVTPTQPVSHIQVENYTALKLSSTVPQRHSAVIKSTLQCGMVNTATRKHNYYCNALG